MPKGADEGPPEDDRLDRIRALTEAPLAHLEFDELLDELLDRIVEAFDADTAVVLLLDEPSGQLVATAARGIEEEVRQGVRVPLGRGFAGRVAAQRQPVVLDRIDPTTVWNPLLWEKGIRAMLGVPLISGGRLLGVLHIGNLRAREFKAEDVRLLQVVADRVAVAAHASILGTEHAAALALQRSLVPAELPACPGLELAARYVPAEAGLGGDWYDVFMLPSGVVWVVTGDVQGHGFRSAIVMGRLRSTIRAYAMEGHGPADVVALTDQKLQHFEPTEMATVVCVALAPPYDEFRLCAAGHPPPALATSDAPCELLKLQPTPPLGVAPGVERSEDAIELPDAAVLFLYTDGLVERRYESVDTGLERLCAALEPAHPELVCHRVMSRLLGGARPEDDVAVLAVRRSSEQAPGSDPIPV
jgi:putative methionine-R-sulfoxide reductase with GAF domain